MPFIQYNGRRQHFKDATVVSDDGLMTLGFEATTVTIRFEDDDGKAIDQQVDRATFNEIIFGERMEDFIERKEEVMVTIPFKALVEANRVTDFCGAYGYDPDRLRHAPEDLEVKISVSHVQVWL